MSAGAQTGGADEEADRPGVLAPPPLLYVPGLVLGLLIELAVPLPGLPG